MPRRPFSWMSLSSLSKSNIGSWRRAGASPARLPRPGAGGVDEVEKAEGQAHQQIAAGGEMARAKRAADAPAEELIEGSHAGQQECPAQDHDRAGREVFRREERERVAHHPDRREPEGVGPPPQHRGEEKPAQHPRQHRHQGQPHARGEKRLPAQLRPAPEEEDVGERRQQEHRDPCAKEPRGKVRLRVDRLGVGHVRDSLCQARAAD